MYILYLFNEIKHMTSIFKAGGEEKIPLPAFEVEKIQEKHQKSFCIHLTARFIIKA